MNKSTLEHDAPHWIESPVLQEQYDRLSEENRALQEELRTLYVMIRSIGLGQNGENWRRALVHLRNYTQELSARLIRHAEVESQGLYELMKRYGAPEAGMLRVFEQESELGRLYTEDFVRAVEALPEFVGDEPAKETANLLMQAYYIWLEHLRKEQEFAFPLARQVLSRRLPHLM